MRIRCNVRAWTCLSVCLGLSLLPGCGGSKSNAPLTPAPAASSGSGSASPAAASMAAEPTGGGGETQPGTEGDAGAAAGASMSTGLGPNGTMPEGGMLGGTTVSGMPGSPGMDMMPMPGGGPTPGMGMTPGMEGGMNGMGLSMGGSGMPGQMGMGMGMGGGGPAIQDPAPPEDADYLTKAKYAFAIGKETEAEQYAIAHLLANDSEGANLLQQVRFAPGPRKPALTLRFGVGVNLTAPSSITDYKPIGRTQFAQAAGQGGGGGSGELMGMPMPGGGGQQSGGGAQKNLGDLTGRFGEELIKSFEGSWESGVFGTVFNEVDTISPIKGIGTGGFNGGGMSGGGMMPGMGSSMAPDGGGMMGAGMGMPGGGGPAPGAAPADEALRIRATPGKAIVPGLTYLGTGKESELLGKAEGEGIDYVFMFEVEVKPQRQGIGNETKLKLMVVKDKKSIGSTSTLNNMKVDREMAMKGDNDEVAKQLANLFRKVETIKLQDMVKLTPAQAQARIKSLIEKKTKDVLPILMEIKLYHSQGFLNDEERDAAYQLTLPNGLAFANGSPEDRDFVLGPLLSSYK